MKNKKPNNYYIENGVAYWKSNDRAIPVDCVENYDIPVNPEIQQNALDKELHDFIESYRKNPPKYTDEDKAEMRSAFGEGETIINVITGEKIKL